jgi:hypothetical protein
MINVTKGSRDIIGNTKLGKGDKLMGVVDKHGLPLTLFSHAENKHETKLMQLSLEIYMIE